MHAPARDAGLMDNDAERYCIRETIDFHYQDQSGFRPGHSTKLATLRFVDTLVQQMDNFYVPTCILIDLSKAFDTLEHDIVLSKLRYYGISGVELNFFASYLLERFQYVDYSGVYSKKFPITTVEPQGSVLGPLLFLKRRSR